MKPTKTSLGAAAVGVLAAGTAAVAMTSLSSSPGSLRNVAADVPPTPPKAGAPPRPGKPVPVPVKPKKPKPPKKVHKPTHPPVKPVICIVKEGGKVGAGAGAGVSIGIGIGVTIGPEIRATVGARVSAHLGVRASAHVVKVIEVRGVRACVDVQTWQTVSGTVVVKTVPAVLKLKAKVNVAVTIDVAAKVFGFTHYSPAIVHGKKALIGEVGGQAAVLVQANAGAWTLVSCSGQAPGQAMAIADVLAQSS